MLLIPSLEGRNEKNQKKTSHPPQRHTRTLLPQTKTHLRKPRTNRTHQRQTRKTLENGLHRRRPRRRRIHTNLPKTPKKETKLPTKTLNIVNFISQHRHNNTTKHK